METDPRFDPVQFEEDEPPFRNLYVLSMKVYMGLVCLAALSFILERFILFIFPRLVMMPLPLAIFFVLMAVSAFMVNHQHSLSIQTMTKKDICTWWNHHKKYPLKSLIADLCGALLGIAPSVLISLHFFGVNIIPHLLCLLIAINILVVTPKRKPPESWNENRNEFS